MTLSVGLARIVNDPDATIRTRQALGRLATPGLLVTDQGITIDTNGRIVLRLSSGLTESVSGLSVKVKSGGGIVAGDDGLALDDPLGDITFTNITVNQNANITGDVNVAGNVNTIGAVTTPVLNSGTITNTGDIASGTATIVGNASVGGTFTGVIINAGTLAVSGNGTVAGTLTTLTLAVTGNAGIAGSMGCGSAAVGGALTAASADVAGNLTAATATIGGNQLTALGLISNLANFTSVGVSGVFSAGSANVAGNATIGGNLSVAGTITGGGGGSGAITPNSVRINSGTTIVRCLSFFVTFTFDPSSSVSDYFFSLPGAFSGDMAHVSPIGNYSNYMGSWSAAMYADGACLVRCVRPYTTSSGVTVFVTARITVFGFA